MGKPKAYAPPAMSGESRDQLIQDQRALESAGAPYGDNPWIVVCDRDGNPTYTAAEDDRKVFKTINFRDWFYVVEDRDRWIRIGKAEVGPKYSITSGTFQDYGWVEKSRMLLWTSSIVNAQSGIQKKAWIINKAENIAEILQLKNENIIDIYNSPEVSKPSDDPGNTFETYFIYKYENNRYLLGKDNKFGTRGVESLVGWVSAHKCVEWNTRIALEPNFDQAAFKERKDNPKFRIYGYKSQSSADKQARQGNVNYGDVYWEDDPVTQNEKYMAETNRRRFKGGVFRFPLLSCSERFVRSGVIGQVAYQTLDGKLEQVNEAYYSNIRARFDEKSAARYSYDILIAVEATPAIKEYQQAIVAGVEAIRKELIDVDSLRWGLVLYRDIPEEGNGKMCTVKAFTADVDEFVHFIKNAEFRAWEDTDPWTTLLYGLEQGLSGLGLNRNHTSIMLVIGSNGDFRRSSTRLEQHKTHPACVPPARIVEHLGDYSVNFAAIQCQNMDTPEHCTEVFQDQVRNLLLKTAVLEYQRISGENQITGAALPAPVMPDMDGLAEALVQGGTSFGYIRKPAWYGSLSQAEVSAAMGEAARRIRARQEEIWRQLYLIVGEGGAFEEVSSGNFSPALLGIFRELIEEGKLTKEDLKTTAVRRYKLYTEVYFPTHIAGARYPAFSPVLFMPEDDLRRYLDVINQLALAIDKSPDERRKYLKQTLLELADQYAGATNEKEIRQLTVEELRNRMQGFQREACILPSKWNDLKIENINNRDKVKDEEVETWVGEIVKNTTELRQIAGNKSYEFKYQTANNTYYWIPLEFMF